MGLRQHLSLSDNDGIPFSYFDSWRWHNKVEYPRRTIDGTKGTICCLARNSICVEQAKAQPERLPIKFAAWSGLTS